MPRCWVAMFGYIPVCHQQATIVTVADDEAMHTLKTSVVGMTNQTAKARLPSILLITNRTRQCNASSTSKARTHHSAHLASLRSPPPKLASYSQAEAETSASTTHNTQHTTHNAKHTKHNTQHTTPQDTQLNTQHTTHNTQHTRHKTQDTTQHTQNTDRYTHVKTGRHDAAHITTSKNTGADAEE